MVLKRFMRATRMWISAVGISRSKALAEGFWAAPPQHGAAADVDVAPFA